MPRTVILALAAAVLAGVAIGAQASINSSAGRLTGAVLAGLLVNFLGGAAAGVILLGLYLRQGSGTLTAVSAGMWGLLVVAGLLGIGIMIAGAYALPKIGVVAGLAALIAGQMVVALGVDTLGWAGGAPIPLDLARLAGLGLLAAGIWLMLPKG